MPWARIAVFLASLYLSCYVHTGAGGIRPTVAAGLVVSSQTVGADESKKLPACFPHLLLSCASKSALGQSHRSHFTCYGGAINGAFCPHLLQDYRFGARCLAANQAVHES